MPRRPSLDVVKKVGYSGADVARFLKLFCKMNRVVNRNVVGMSTFTSQISQENGVCTFITQQKYGCNFRN